MRSDAALSMWYLGYPDQALRQAEDNIKLAREIAHPYSLCYAIHHLGWLQEHCRLGTAVQASAEAELVIANEQGFPFWKATGALCRAAGLLLQNKPAEALEQARHGLTAFRATGAGLSVGHYLSYIAEAHWQLGQLGEALKVIDEALAANARNHNDFCTSNLLRIKGDILLAQSPHNESLAEACFHEALVVAERQCAKSWELRAAMSLCRLWQKQGKQADARARLTAVYDWFTEGFATPDLQDAKNLLAAWA